MKQSQAVTKAVALNRKFKEGAISEKEKSEGIAALSEKSKVPVPKLLRLAVARAAKEAPPSAPAAPGSNPAESSDGKITKAHLQGLVSIDDPGAAEAEEEDPSVPFAIRDTVTVNKWGVARIKGLPPGTKILALSIPMKDSALDITTQPIALMAGTVRRRCITLAATYSHSEEEEEEAPEKEEVVDEGLVQLPPKKARPSPPGTE